MKRNTLLWIFLSATALTLSACKQNAIEPVPELTVDDITHYFWHDTTSQQTFVDDNGKTANTLTFTAGRNGFGVYDLMNTSTGKLAFDVSSSQIMGTGFKPGSILDLDPKSYFAADPN